MSTAVERIAAQLNNAGFGSARDVESKFVDYLRSAERGWYCHERGRNDDGGKWESIESCYPGACPAWQEITRSVGFANGDGEIGIRLGCGAHGVYIYFDAKGFAVRALADDAPSERQWLEQSVHGRNAMIMNKCASALLARPNINQEGT